MRKQKDQVLFLKTSNTTTNNNNNNKFIYLFISTGSVTNKIQNTKKK